MHHLRTHAHRIFLKKRTYLAFSARLEYLCFGKSIASKVCQAIVGSLCSGIRVFRRCHHLRVVEEVFGSGLTVLGLSTDVEGQSASPQKVQPQ